MSILKNKCIFAFSKAITRGKEGLNMVELNAYKMDFQSVTMKVSLTGSDSAILIGDLKDGKFLALSNGVNNNVVFAGVSEGNAVINRMVGIDYEEVVELMTKAVNNRTRQRNYFRLYSQMCDGEITEEEFYNTIEENEDDYVVEESEIPTKERLMHALKLSKGMKDVKSSEDISTLFSFDSYETDKKLEEMDAYDCLQ